ncbi:MAG: hypothetical protein ACOYNL_10750, partial [Rickettsiales bacterium]
MANPNIYKIRPDMTPTDGITNYDTVSQIAAEWLRQNKGQQKLDGAELKGSFQQKLKAVEAWIKKTNRLKTNNGKDCVDFPTEIAIIKVGQDLVLPEGNPVISPKQSGTTICVDPKPLDTPIRVTVATIPPAITTVVQEAPAPVIPAPAPQQKVTGVPLAQAIVNPKGTVVDAVKLDDAMFFIGRPPK